MAQRLWDKGDALREDVQALMVGDDTVIDPPLAWADAVGSAAHVRMLAAVGLFPREQVAEVCVILREVYEDARAGRFTLPDKCEDMHSAIELRLSERLGEAGRRVHAARSRNDQIQTVMRIYLREAILDRLTDGAALVRALVARAEKEGHLELPGYTHFQLAMPASVKMWLHAFAEWGLELLKVGESIRNSADTCPLGAAAGFGVPLPIDRAQVAALLGFSSVQRNPIDVNNSRGRYEQRFLRWCVEWVALFEKFACDLMLFTTSEFGFVSLSHAMSTGSSAMPQKRNPDLIELMRGSAGKVRGALSELDWILAKLPSSYHRDFQYSKAPLVRGARGTDLAAQMCHATLEGISFNRGRLKESMKPELYATYYAYRLVAKGVPFRDAYQQTAALLVSGTLDVADLARDFEPIARQVDVALEQVGQELSRFEATLSQERTRVSSVYESLFSAQ